MKLFFALFLFLTSFSSFSQPYPEPDFVEKPMYYNTTTKEIHAIERQIRPFKEITAGMNQTLYFRDPTSFYRIKQSDGVQFLIKLVNSVEPDLILFLYPLQTQDDFRYLKLHLNPFSSTQKPAYLPFHYHKVGDSTYLLTFDNFAPGEYLWYFKHACYLFAVE